MSNNQLSIEQFTKQAIVGLRMLHLDKDGKPRSKGIHSVFSGFYEALRSEYNLSACIKPKCEHQGNCAAGAMNKLVAQGKIASLPRKKGPMLYLPADAPPDKRKTVLAAIKAATV